jgi:hypothetical protein
MTAPFILDEYLAGLKADAERFKKYKGSKVRLIEMLHREFCEHAGEYLIWLSEDDARQRSGKGPDFLRSRRKACWQADGHAVKRGSTWYYRAVVVPRRTLPSIASAEELEEAA